MCPRRIAPGGKTIKGRWSLLILRGAALEI